MPEKIRLTWELCNTAFSFDKLLGNVLVDAWSEQVPFSIIYYCPRCGHVWGRRYAVTAIPTKTKSDTRWIAEARPCAVHGDGSFLYDTANFRLSLDALKREFNLYRSTCYGNLP